MIPKHIQKRQADIDWLMDEFLALSPVPIWQQRPWIALFERNLNLECWVFDGQGETQFPDTQVASLSRNGRTITWHGRVKVWGAADPEHHQDRDWPRLVAERLVTLGQSLLYDLQHPRSKP